MRVNELKDEIKISRRQRWVNTSIILLALLVALLNFSLVRSALPVNSSIGPQGTIGLTGATLQGKDGYIPIKGIDYSDGKDGINGKNGVNGQDGQSIVGPVGPTGPSGPQGDRGEAGEPGAPARAEEQQCTGTPPQIQHRYQGDDGWTTLYYLPIGSMCP